MAGMLLLTGILGEASDPAIAERLHALEHAGRVERLRLGADDMLRRRLRAATDRGTDCAVALRRGERLSNGAVLLLEADRAILVVAEEEALLSLVPRDVAAALELGYFAGNMHWPVRFEGGTLHVIRAGPEEAYLERLAHLLADGRVRKAGHG